MSCDHVILHVTWPCLTQSRACLSFSLLAQLPKITQPALKHAVRKPPCKTHNQEAVLKPCLFMFCLLMLAQKRAVCRPLANPWQGSFAAEVFAAWVYLFVQMLKIARPMLKRVVHKPAAIPVP
eukprot:1160721-Pelagomonas_calceolata.AAC.4